MTDTNIYTISLNHTFLDVLARGIWRRYGDDPLLFSSVNILLPNRRSCRALREVFIKITKDKPLLLPSMHPLDDIGEEEAPTSLIAGGRTFDLPPTLSATQTYLILTELVEKWQCQQSDRQSFSTANAARLAIELANFLEEVQREQRSLNELENIVPAQFAKHWQITLKFLHILVEHWPKILKEKGVLDRAGNRNMVLSLQTKYWQEHPSPYPVIAAGSTGSIPATADLLKVIAKMPGSAVVLPGLDQYMSDPHWDLLEPSHPQYGLKQLIEHIGINRWQVEDWLGDNDVTSGRADLMSRVMSPANASEQWQKSFSYKNDALQHICRVDANTHQEEAQIIALMMRESLEQSTKNTALVTHDRDLAKHVSSIMQRWNITVDDSAGYPFNQTTVAVFMRLVAQMAEPDASPISVLACLKHPLAAGFMEPHIFRQRVRWLECKMLRGVRPGNGFDAILALCNRADEDWFNILHVSFLPLLKLFTKSHVAFDQLLTCHIKCSEQLASTKRIDGKFRLWDNEQGKQLREILNDLCLCAADFKEISPADYISLFNTLLGNYRFRPRYGGHPRLSILSPIEARLQSFDRVILGGLNEGLWPKTMAADPWMSRPMRNDFGLPLPERIVGMSAHDFTQLCCAPDVILTRCKKSNGSPTIPSRWLLRLQAYLAVNRQGDFLRGNVPWVIWSRTMQHVDSIQQIKEPPKPSPPVSSRPTRYSVSIIEALMRNPYAVYANKILKLRPFDPLDQDPGGAVFGTIVHQVLDCFVKRYEQIDPEGRVSFMKREANLLLRQENVSPALAAMWWPRLDGIFAWFSHNEAIRRQDNLVIASEVTGNIAIPINCGHVELVAKADRIESSSAGEINIIDYKTGNLPSKLDVRLGYAPQLLIEALIANEKGFDHLAGNVAKLVYWRLTGREKAEEHEMIRGEAVNELLCQGREGLNQLLTYFHREKSVYLFCPIPSKAPLYNNYSHLAREKEWTA